MKTIFTNTLIGKKILFSVLFILAIISYGNIHAQCTVDTVAPIPDVTNLPEIISECTAQLKRPTAFDECEGKPFSGTVPGNQLSYTVGTYTVTWTYTDGTGNKSSQTQKVTVLPLTAPVITTLKTPIFCKGDSITLTWQVPIAPLYPVTYSGFQWTTDGGTYTTKSIVAKTSGTYSLTVNTVDGCSATSTQSVVVDTAAPPVPNITASGSTTICEGTSVVLRSSSATNNKWKGGSALDSLIVTTAGTFSVTVANGCGSKTSLGKKVVVLPLTPTITVGVSGATTVCPNDSVVMISNSIKGNIWYGGSPFSANNNDTLKIFASATKTYTLTVNNGCAAASSTTIKITVKPKPAKPTLEPLSKVCFDNSNQFTALLTTVPLPIGSPAGGTYSGLGVIGTSFYPALAFGIAGGFGIITYTIKDTATGCTNAATDMVTIDTSKNCTTGIIENSLTVSTSIYPNPANNILNIDITKANFNQLNTSIIDVLGNEVYSSLDALSANGFHKQINVENLTKGIYFIRLLSGADVFTQKVIIQ
jgi:large repetitive protein